MTKGTAWTDIKSDGSHLDDVERMRWLQEAGFDTARCVDICPTTTKPSCLAHRAFCSSSLCRHASVTSGKGLKIGVVAGV